VRGLSVHANGPDVAQAFVRAVCVAIRGDMPSTQYAEHGGQVVDHGEHIGENIGENLANALTKTWRKH